MKNLLVVFSHGKESGPWGSKIRALAHVAERLGAQVTSVDYREHPAGTAHGQNAVGEADRRVGQLLSITPPEHCQLVLVGSSMGGYVSTVASIRFAKQHQCDLYLLDGDHRLNAALPKIEPLFELFLKQVMATSDVQP